MKRNSNTLFLQSPGATTPVPWIDGSPDFSAFTDPTLSVLQSAWQAFLDSGEELEIIPDPEPILESPSPDWDEFNLILFTDSAFVGYGLEAESVNPWIVPAVIEAYGKFAKEGLASGFGNYWKVFCQALGVPQTQKDYWADLAESFNLPTDFVAIVRGSTP